MAFQYNNINSFPGWLADEPTSKINCHIMRKEQPAGDLPKQGDSTGF
jgi:hypothetical protein